MFPTIPIGPLRLQTYGLVLLLAYLAGTWLAARQARRYGIDGDQLFNLSFYALLVGIVTARLGHVVVNFQVYRADPLQVLSLSPGALLLLPGLLGAAAMAAFTIVRQRLPIARTLDALALGLLLALAVASLGSLLAGRDLGAVSSLPWAMELFGVRRHPVALIQALALLAWLGWLLWSERGAARPPGQTALLALFGYAVLRLFLEPLCAESVLVGDGWRLAQIAALAVAVLSGWLLGRGEWGVGGGE
ncbi:MAG: prolipoprotein diacylglyceryl transferase family protein [Anaerolineae bacterium]